jgi:chitin synthase
MSTYSNSSSVPGAGRHTVSAAQHPTPVSTTTLLNALYATYTSGQPYRLDASTSLVVNTWLTVSSGGVGGGAGGTVDTELAGQAWEHARRRAEDGCVLLGYASFSGSH